MIFVATVPLNKLIIITIILVITQDTLKVLNIFKSRCKDVLASRKLINFTSDVTSQPEMLRNHTDDVLSTDREYVMQLFEHSSIRMDEVVDNHCSDFRQLGNNVKNEEIYQLFNIWHICRMKLELGDSVQLHKKKILIQFFFSSIIVI